MLRNSIRNGCKNLYFALKKYLQTKFISDVNFPPWLGKSVNPNFWQYQPNRNNDKFTCSLEIQSNITEIITICTLNPLKVPLNQIHIWYQFPVNVKLPWPSKSVHPHFSQYQSYKNNGKFNCCFQNHWKMAAIISVSTLACIPLIWVKNHFLIWRHFPVVGR